MKRHLVIALLGFLTASIGTYAQARSVYLNGTDISSSRGQDMQNVSIHINEKGDIFIIAPHYQVIEADSYVPLSKFVQGMNTPVHKKPVGVSEMGAGAIGFGSSIPMFENGQLKKAGDPTPSMAQNSEVPEIKEINTNETPSDTEGNPQPVTNNQ